MDLTLEINTENKYNNNKNKIQQRVPTSKEYFAVYVCYFKTRKQLIKTPRFPVFRHQLQLLHTLILLTNETLEFMSRDECLISTNARK